MRLRSLCPAPLLMLTLLACRQPSAELELPSERGPEPSNLGGPSVIVEPPPTRERGSNHTDGVVELDWTRVDNGLAGLITGERVRVEYDDSHPYIGADVPLVTVVVFGDYECPYCARFDQTLDELLAQYPTQLRVVYRQFPLSFHHNARFAAAVALAAHGRGQFAAMHDWLYESRDHVERGAAHAGLSSLGLDPQQIQREIDNGDYDERIEADIQLGTHVGVNGTPAYFINCRPGSGALPRADIETIIREELALADQLIAAGSSPGQVWARILAASAPEPNTGP